MNAIPCVLAALEDNYAVAYFVALTPKGVTATFSLDFATVFWRIPSDAIEALALLQQHDPRSKRTWFIQALSKDEQKKLLDTWGRWP